MCGLSGWANIRNPEARTQLALSLALGIDKRGGHSAGFLALNKNKKIVRGRSVGSWEDQRLDFYTHAISSDAALMHARFATCGLLSKRDAHPFKVDRDDKTVLYGMHNGQIYNADESAYRNERKFTVDSLELFELLADWDLEAIGNLEGYGTIVFVYPSKPDHVFMVRMTDDAELIFADVNGGGFVYASTLSILNNAIQTAQMSVKQFWQPKTGLVHCLTLDGKCVPTDTSIRMLGLPTVTPILMAGSKYEEPSEKAWHGELDDDMWNRWLSSESIKTESLR